MITAVDTNIMLDILVPNEDFYEVSAGGYKHPLGRQISSRAAHGVPIANTEGSGPNLS